MKQCAQCFVDCAPGVTCPACGFDNGSLQEGPFLPPGTVLANRYLIGRPLGRGGFGITYLAYHQKLSCRLAIKEYFPDACAARETGAVGVLPNFNDAADGFAFGLRKFIDEAQTIALMRHPHIVSTYDAFEANDTAYFVMPFIEGCDLEEHVRTHGPLSLSQLSKLLDTIGGALEYVHTQGVTHRDVKPANIMRRPNGDLVLVDFGGARVHTLSRSVSVDAAVSHGFSPVEQYSSSGKHIGPWTDVYGLGATTYYCLTGRVPEHAVDRQDKDTVSSSLPIHPELSTSLQDSLLHALAVNRRDRTQTIDDFVEPWRDAADDADSRQSASDRPTGRRFAVTMTLLGLGLLGLLATNSWTASKLRTSQTKLEEANRKYDTAVEEAEDERKNASAAASAVASAHAVTKRGAEAKLKDCQSKFQTASHKATACETSRGSSEASQTGHAKELKKRDAVIEGLRKERDEFRVLAQAATKKATTVYCRAKTAMSIDMDVAGATRASKSVFPQKLTVVVTLSVDRGNDVELRLWPRSGLKKRMPISCGVFRDAAYHWLQEDAQQPVYASRKKPRKIRLSVASDGGVALTRLH